MFYVSKAKEIASEEEYSAVVLRVEDAAPFLAEGYEVATREQWELVQSEEVKAAIAAGEYADVAPEAVEAAEEAPVALEEPIVEPIAEEPALEVGE